MRQQDRGGYDVHHHAAPPGPASLVVPARRGRLTAILRVTAIGAFAAAAACAPLHLGSSSSDDDWNATLAIAQARASHGEFDLADTALARFAERHVGSPGAVETAYWRALFKLDPSNRGMSVTQALASLDGYLADAHPREHVAEANTLRRTAAQIEALNKLASSASTQARDASSAAANAKAAAADAKSDARAADANANATSDAKDSEIKRLKEELAKANAELDRIRKRLGSPPSRP